MSNIIEARVRQKTDTLANWNANDLVLLGGEPAFVLSQDGKPVNFKLGDGTKTFADLPFWIQYDQAAFIPVSGLALPTPSQPVGYSILGEGTYTHTSGGFTVLSGHWGVANWDGSAWSFSDMGFMPTTPVDGTVTQYNTKAVSGGEVFNALDPIQKALNPTKNKINYRDFKGGTYTVQAVTNKVIFGPGPNWISIKISGLKPNTTYNLHGIDPDIGASSPLIMFSDSTETFISSVLKSEFTGTFTTPSNIGYTYIAIANKTGIGTGTNPQNNAFVNTAMLSEGASTIPFEPYGFNVQVSTSNSVVNGDTKPVTSNAVYQELLPIKNNIASNSKDISDIKPSFESSLNLADYMKFVSGGWITSIVGSETKVSHSPSNNWISIQIDGLEPGQTYNVQGYHTGIGSANDLILHSDASNTLTGKMTKSEVDTATGNFTVPSNTQHTYIRIANVVNIGLNPTVNAYTNTFMVSKGSGNKSFVQYSSGLLLASKIKEDYPKMFVEMIPVTTPYAGTEISREVARVYEKIKGGVYACHSVRYQYLAYADFVSGSSDFHGGKVVRYAGSKLVTYNKSNNTFSDVGQTLIIIPESEFVLNAGGWSGGYHGNEDYTTVHFLINNKVHNPTGDVNFPALGVTAINSFSFTVQSQVVIEGTQAPLADRKKVNSFVDGGYHVKSRFKWLQARSMMMYTGICCVGKSFTDVATDSGKIVSPTGSGEFLVDNDNFAREVFYKSPNVELTVSSRIIDPSIDVNAIVRIWDRASDTKYYRQLPSYVSVVGGVLEVEQKVSIK